MGETNASESTDSYRHSRYSLDVMTASTSAERRRDRPFGGEQVMVFNQNEDGSFGLYGCEDISWFGSIELYGRTLGMALYPIEFGIEDDGLLHYEEGWRIFTENFEVKDGKLKRCDPGSVLAAGEDEGVGSYETMRFESYGTVDYVHPTFRSWRDRTVHQEGVIQPVSFSALEDVSGFYGSLQLQ